MLLEDTASATELVALMLLFSLLLVITLLLF